MVVDEILPIEAEDDTLKAVFAATAVNAKDWASTSVVTVTMPSASIAAFNAARFSDQDAVFTS